jgi:hypothetical protein
MYSVLSVLLPLVSDALCPVEIHCSVVALRRRGCTSRQHVISKYGDFDPNLRPPNSSLRLRSDWPTRPILLEATDSQSLSATGDQESEDFTTGATISKQNPVHCSFFQISKYRLRP